MFVRMDFSWGLIEQKKPAEAIQVLHDALTRHPKNKNIHRQLGMAYRAAGNDAKDVEESMVFLALTNGNAVDNAATVAGKAPATSQAAKTLASDGAPTEVWAWDASNEKYETWFYWDKKKAYHFKAGALVVKSDWATADTKITSKSSAK